jgi:hypothetical protein
MKLIYIKLLFLFILTMKANFVICESNSKFDIVDSNNYSFFITNILVDNNIILCGASHDGILISLDSGFNWHIVNKGFIQDNENNIIGIKKINDKYVAWTLEGRLYYSDDTAKSWKIYSTFFDSNNISITDLTPISDSVIYLSSNKGMYLSLDDGKRWNFMTEFVEDEFGFIYYINDTIYISNNTIYFKRINEKVWNSYRNIPKIDFIFSDIAFSKNRTIISTDKGIYYTTDFGNRWQDITFDIIVPKGGYEGIIQLYSIDDRIYVCKDDGLYLLIEENNSWLRCNIFINNNNFDVYHDKIFAWVIKKINNNYFMGSLGFGIFKSKDGINFYHENIYKLKYQQ